MHTHPRSQAVDEKDSTPLPQVEPLGWARRTITDKCERFEQLHRPGVSRRQIAQQLDVPRSTLQDWLRQKQQRRQQSTLPQGVVEFFESPDGVDVLHRLMTAIQLVFGQAANGGIRNTCMFLRLSGLDQFVAASYGAQQAAAEEIERAIVQFGNEEDQRLAAQMPDQNISIAEDETFHPQCCLVGLEPVSNFILLEQYADRRDTETWQHCLDQRLENLPVNVLQVTSDHAKALIRHAEVCLGAHHSPDLFHIQHETVKATGFALANQHKRAQKALEQAHQLSNTTGSVAGLQQRMSTKHLFGRVASEFGPSRSDDDRSRTTLANLPRSSPTSDRCAARDQRRLPSVRPDHRRAANCVVGLSPPTGRTSTDCETVQQRLTEHFDQWEAVTEEASLSQAAHDRLAKARRALPGMHATIVFFWTTVTAWLESWQFPTAVCELMRTALIPACYLRLAAGKASTAKQRKRLLALADEVEARARSPGSAWWSLDEAAQQQLLQRAQRCAELFQRSSSCVEGRNGHLALKHHALHRLTARKLNVLTVLHNYLVRREDKTTAAERFYGQRPRDLFTWLLTRVSYPVRPRR